MTHKEMLEKAGYLFYIASPNRSSFETIEEVPNYVVEVVPFFMVLLILEILIATFTNKNRVRINDGFGSISQGMIQELMRVLARGVELTAYIYIYDNWRIATLPWNSPWTWFICFLGVDLGYYCLHRASHEINILWAAHQVHHSSEDYNLSTALRQSMFQTYSVWMFYLPMAFCIPPSIFLVHNQFNLLFQFWIHTEVIETLGPLELILNTPSHHRVHHGRNRYCIDKNYAGVLIIWDRMFGTFQPEKEKVVYGLTHPINTFSIFYTQLCHYKHILQMLWETPGVMNKLWVIFKGPGWSPGKPRLGLIEDIPDVPFPVEKYDPQIGAWCKLYLIIHFLLVLLGHIEITERYGMMSQTMVLGFILYQIFSLTTIGALLDKRYYGPWLEVARCLTYLLVDYHLSPIAQFHSIPSEAKSALSTFLRICYTVSSAIWTTQCVKSLIKTT